MRVLGAEKLNANCRGQHLSANDLLERVEEDDKMQVGHIQMQHKSLNITKVFVICIVLL